MHLIDLSHTMADGLQTYKGLPPLHICDFLSRKESRQHYASGTEFQLDRIELVGNSGTYIDSPFHRFADGADLAALPLDATVALPAITIRAPHLGHWDAVGPHAFNRKALEGKAVLIETGWCKHFGTPAYFEHHPFLTEDAANLLRDAGAALVGIDSHNIDDTRANTRPVHTVLLGAGIPIVEHMTNLSALPDQGYRFFAAPLKFQGVGTFPTRAFAMVEEAPQRPEKSLR
jgi:kynurenine formamidase